MDNYKKRLLDSTIKEYFKELPALSIDGAKAVGKTATAIRYAKHIMHLDIEEGIDVIAGGLDV
ncbi:MAG: AAA family ATPase, partial [Coriobacteriia bacterium]|nr:AAA family ATPase [Coriobacteriia bacterium]